jgi:hypothetical protein
MCLRHTLGKKPYEKMAQEFDINVNYFRGEVVPRLNRLLSEVFEEKIGFSSNGKIRLKQLYLESLAEIEEI